MRYLVNAAQMKEYDKNTIQIFGIPSLVLMERAALAVLEELTDGSFVLDRVLVVCGSGNNGGDGFAIARLLHEKNIETTILFAGKEESLTEETGIQKKICENYGMNICSICSMDEYTCIVDALFGVGLSREIGGSYYDLIKEINHAPAKVLAVDMPSGISADSGAVMGIAVHAAKTVTFAFGKIGQYLYPGAACCGQVIVRDIGITQASFCGQFPHTICKDEKDLDSLPQRIENSHKGTYGKAMLVAGTYNMAGAAYLTGSAAYRMGTGLVRIVTEECNRIILQQKLPEAVLSTYDPANFRLDMKEILEWPTAVGIGPGLGTMPEKKELLRLILMKGSTPLVMDADALNILAGHLEWLDGTKKPIIVTPHLLEMSRMTGIAVEKIKKQPVRVCQEFAEKYQLICVLKDARTVISDGTNVCINTTGNNGMSTGGAGDVLTGMVTALLAQGMPAFEAACMGVWIHGKAGEAAAKKHSPRAMLAGDMVQELSTIFTTADEIS